MAVTTRSGRGGDVHASRDNRVPVDEDELQNDEIPLVVEDVVEPSENDDGRIAIDEGEEETQEAVKPSREHVVIDMPEPERSMESETIKMTHQVSAIVHSMAPKLEYPGTSTIPCTIRSADFAKALCDLGASINLMPYSVFMTLGIGQPHPTSMRLQMAVQSMKRPLGIIDDVLVRVDKFILPADFMILDCEVDFEVEATLAVPQKRKRAIGWTLVDIRGISPAFCMHKIILEDDSRPFLEHQRRLNEAMQEVVKKEVIKWLDADVVYPISDSSWTSPVQCVTKNGGTTVVTNDNNELIPTRTVTGWRLSRRQLDVAANLRVEQVNELDEFRLHAYSSSSLYKDKMKYLHDKYARGKEFKVGDMVLLFNSRLRLFPGKLKSKWSCPFEVVGITPFGAIDLKNKNGEVFRVNGHRVKHYFGKIDDSHVVARIHLK
ncbi:uncharacterized protein [Nicotiana sylvestris]|uniref:uncharacterized protein n=1 Tax=Nicotiana sylvestris TaxID=4096 RepID=UPI00388CB4BB